MEDRAISLNDIKKAIGILKTEYELQMGENAIKTRLLVSDVFCKMLEIIETLPSVTLQGNKKTIIEALHGKPRQVIDDGISAIEGTKEICCCLNGGRYNGGKDNAEVD